MIAARLLVASALAAAAWCAPLACIVQPAVGKPCTQTAQCGDGRECVQVIGRNRAACFPVVAREQTACEDDVACFEAGFPVESDCAAGSCRCADGALDCGEGRIVDPARCACVASQGFAGERCFLDEHCESGVCFQGECRAGRGIEGDLCERNGHCAGTCIDGRCRDFSSEGEPCDDADDCASFSIRLYCVNAFCQDDPGDVGDPCFQDVECRSRICGSDGRCE